MEPTQGLDGMAELLAAELARGPTVTAEDQEQARTILTRLGIPGLLAAQAISAEIIRFGDGFHPIARFFADGSPEQRYILDVLSGEEASGPGLG